MSPQIALVLGGIQAHIPLIQSLKARGYTVILVDYYTHPVAKSDAHDHVQESAADAEAVWRLALRYKAQLIISTCSGQLNAIACEVSERLGLPRPYGSAVAENTTHKLRMKTIMQQFKIPTAPFVSVTGGEAPAIETLTWPLIVKPVDRCGSKGVRIVHDPQTLHNQLQHALTSSLSDHALIENFQHGREVCLDAVVTHGQLQVASIYEKFNLYSPDTDIQCFRSVRPAALSEALETRLAEIGQNIVTAFALENTPLFLQTIVAGEAIFVIEFAARSPGGIAYRATELASGVDLIACAIASFLNEPVKLQTKRDQGFISTNSIYGSPGIFDRVEGYQRLLEQKIIAEYYPYKTSGMIMGSHLSSQDRVAGFIVKAPQLQELLEKTAMALETLQIYDTSGQPKMLKHCFQPVKNEHIYLKGTPYDTVP